MTNSQKQGNELLKSKFADFDPAKDSYLESTFSSKTLAKRKINKTFLSKKCGFKDSKSVIISVFLPFLEKEAENNLNEILEALFEIDVNLVVLQEGKIHSLEKKKSTQFKLLDAGLKDLHLALAGSDLFLFPSKLKRKGFASNLAMQYGSIPVLPKSETLGGLISDYDPKREKGVAFVYKDNSVWNMFAAIVRACETYKLPYDWKNIQSNAMMLDLEAHL